jgi:hypothetical protein
MCAETRRAAPREFKIYDKSRAGDWTSLVGPTQCAAIFKDFETASPVSYRGEPFHKMSDCTFLLFDRLEEARSFCEAQVKQHPSMCAEIFDHQGRAKEPLLVVVDPSVAEKGELSATSVRKRKIWAIVLFCVGAPLVVYDWTNDWDLIWPAVLGINMTVVGLRLLYWNTGRAERNRERDRRVAEHIAREKSDLMSPKI